jgi:hypothetical protein
VALGRTERRLAGRPRGVARRVVDDSPTALDVRVERPTEGFPLADPITFDSLLRDVVADARRYLASHAPLALLRLNGARDAIERGDSESLAQGATSCRRAIDAITDAIYPSHEDMTVVSRRFGELKIGATFHRNRLVLFFEDVVSSRPVGKLTATQVDYLTALLAPFIKQASKGVHAEIDRVEAERIYMLTVMLIVEIAHHAPRNTSS